jgi:Putative phage holin Dp-1
MDIFGRKTYSVLKSIALIWLPALGTLIFTLGDLWKIPDVKVAQIVGSIMAIDTFLGILLGLSAKSGGVTMPAPDGTLKVDTSNPAKDVYSLEIDTPLADIPDKEHVVLRVEPVQTAHP